MPLLAQAEVAWARPSHRWEECPCKQWTQLRVGTGVTRALWPLGSWSLTLQARAEKGMS